MAIYKNGELNAGHRETPDAGVAAPILSDAQINKHIEDYITLATKCEVLLEAIYRITNIYSLEDNDKTKVIREIVKDYGESK
jgi:hypothetical protein